MKQMARNPYLAFPLGVVLVMTLSVGWSLTQDDRLVINEVFVVILALIPLVAAVYSLIVRARANWFHRIMTGAATAALGMLAAFVVFFASGILIPYDSVPVYNYPHFHYAYYEIGGAEQRVAAGDQALEETLYTLERNTVRLSDLWKERPILVEFGSFT